MKREIHLGHEFVEFIPTVLKERTLYVSTKFGTVVHKCCCGCGYEVVTPLSPADWNLTFDGETISLHPSIGNWSLPCRSHYWITRSVVRWARRWSDEEIELAREEETAAKKEYYEGGNPSEGRKSVKAGPFRTMRRKLKGGL